MKTIRINVPLTVTHEAQDTVTEPIGLGSLFAHGSFSVRRTIYAMAGSVRVTIVGDQQSVQEVLADQKNDPTALVQRALSALGYVVGDHKKDIEQFSRWVDHLAAFPRSEEALALWTSAMLARLNSAEPPMIAETVDEASEAALRVVVQRMRLFPPAPKMGLDDGPPITWDRIKIVGMDLGTKAWAELQEWRTAAKQRGWDTPLAMRGHSALDDAELVAWREAATACGIKSPADLASMKDANFGQFVDKKVVAEWQRATYCENPGEAEKTRDAWLFETGSMTPAGAGEKIRMLRAGYDSACATRNSQADKIKQYEREISEWKKATGTEYPDGAIARARADLDAWQDATGAANSHAAYKRIQELEAKLLSYASEIDALRKAAQSTKQDPIVVNIEHGAHVTLNGQTIGHIHNPERELAKVRAELQSKCRECQTERERADENARTMTARGVLLDRIAEALGRDFNHDSLPEHVADLKRAYDKLDIGQVTKEEVARESAELVEIISSHVSNAGIESAASSIANRYAYLSAALAKTMQAREILQARPGENIVDAAQRAIVPLPKPEKVEAGQKWAFVMKAISITRQTGCATFVDAGAGEHFTADENDFASGFYLGT